MSDYRIVREERIATLERDLAAARESLASVTQERDALAESLAIRDDDLADAREEAERLREESKKTADFAVKCLGAEFCADHTSTISGMSLRDFVEKLTKEGCPWCARSEAARLREALESLWAGDFLAEAPSHAEDAVWNGVREIARKALGWEEERDE